MIQKITLKYATIMGDSNDKDSFIIDRKYLIDDETCELDLLEDAIQSLLVAAGFPQFYNDFIFMKGVSGEEYEYLEEKLNEYRAEEERE